MSDLFRILNSDEVEKFEDIMKFSNCEINAQEIELSERLESVCERSAKYIENLMKRKTNNG